MRVRTVCKKCGNGDIDMIDFDRCYCKKCESKQETAEKVIESLYERQRNAVYATGNRWAIENWNATHN